MCEFSLDAIITSLQVSKSTVTSVVREKRNQDAGIFKPPRRIPPQNQPSVRTKELIGKVRKELGTFLEIYDGNVSVQRYWIYCGHETSCYWSSFG